MCPDLRWKPRRQLRCGGCTGSLSFLQRRLQSWKRRSWTSILAFSPRTGLSPGSLHLAPSQSRPWNSPGKDTDVGTIPVSKGPSRPRDGAHVSCIAGGFFTKAPCGKPDYLQSMPHLTFCIHPPGKHKVNLSSFMAENGSACFICSV